MTEKDLKRILANALVIGKVVGSRKKKKPPKPRPVEGFEDDTFLWDDFPLDDEDEEV